MMKKENWFLLALILIAAFLFLLYPSFGWKIQSFFYRTAQQSLGTEQNLLLENESLKAEIAKLQELQNPPAGGLPLAGWPTKNSLLGALVYSSYPFNFKNEILVNAGEKQGAKSGQAAVIFPLVSSEPIMASPIFAGKVEKVFENTSLVETIYDSRFQMSVRIGKNGVSALLKGGNEPELFLIPKDVEVAEGDAVYSTEPKLPYGLTLGVLANPRISANQFFKEADIETNYNPADLKSLFIVTENYNE